MANFPHICLTATLTAFCSSQCFHISGLDKVLPADIHIRATDRLHVSLTKVADRQNLIVSQFESREHLINTLLASCFIPLLSGWLPPRLNGQLVFDGGYSDNVPVVQANTITVSPFSGNQDICPLDDSELAELLGLNLATGPTTSIAVSKENLARFRMALLPPSAEDLMQVIRLNLKLPFSPRPRPPPHVAEPGFKFLEMATDTGSNQTWPKKL